MRSHLESSRLPDNARTHEASPEQITRDTSEETKNGIESNARPAGLSVLDLMWRRQYAYPQPVVAKA